MIASVIGEVFSWVAGVFLLYWIGQISEAARKKKRLRYLKESDAYREQQADPAYWEVRKQKSIAYKIGRDMAEERKTRLGSSGGEK